jgi:hypothetical protein
MKKLVLALAAFAAPITAFAADDSATVRAEAPAAVQVTAGKMLYSGGNRLAAIYRISNDGSPQVILDGKLVTIPASTLSDVGGKVTTSLSKKDLSKAQ